MKRKQLSLAQTLGDLSNIDRNELIGRKVFFMEKHGSNSKKEVGQGTIIALSEAPGYVIVRTRSFRVVSRPLSLNEIYDDPDKVPIFNIRRKKPFVVKKKKQLSLAQTLGDLSNIDIDTLIGRKVIIECRCTNRNGTPIKRKRIVHGTIKEQAKIPGFVLVKTVKGSVFSRNLKNIWSDVLDA